MRKNSQGSSSLKLAVLADHGRVPRFCLEALDRLDDCTAIDVYSCTNTAVHRDIFRHAGYYALNLVSVRNPLTTPVPITEGKRSVAKSIDFESGYERAWQVLPPAIVEMLSAGGYDVILKFGMNLLRVPEGGGLPPILSYHHGDPASYRGRPAGFWEMSDGAPVLGQIVQVLSNRLDGGKIVAFAETKIHPHSYRATLIEAYRHSPLLLPEAVRAVKSSEFLDRPAVGRLCRLPSNSTVLSFILKMVLRLLRHALYGALFEKRWHVSLAEEPDADLIDTSGKLRLPACSGWRTLPISKDYIFYADPFFSADPPGLLVEALNRRTGLGEIILVDDQGERKLSTDKRHFSYPCTIQENGHQLVVPEIAEWSAPRSFVIDGGVLRENSQFDIEGATSILDPTLIRHEDRLYMFGNILDVGPGALFLWSADSIRDTFRLHPMSPVRISPRGSRMAGGLLKRNGRIIRFGQNFVGAYGDGIYAFEVLELTATRFREALLGELKLGDRRGPHTINVMNGSIAFDWYRDRFSWLAGFRRMLARRQRTRLSTVEDNPAAARGEPRPAHIA